MSRKRTTWTGSGEKLFDALAAQGLPAGEIAKRMTDAGEKGASRATVGRRLAERAGPRRSGRAGNADAPPTAPDSEPMPESEPIPDVALEVPDADAITSLVEVEMWIKRVDRAYVAAEKVGNVAAIAALSARATGLFDIKRKLTPAPAPDPNDRPDLQAAADRARALMRKKLEGALARRSK